MAKSCNKFKMAIHHKPDLIKTNHLYFQIQHIKIVLKQLKFVKTFFLAVAQCNASM